MDTEKRNITGDLPVHGQFFAQDFNGEKLRSLFASAPIGIAILRDRRIMEVNDMVCAMTGYSRNELAGQDSGMLYPDPEDYECAVMEITGHMRNHTRTGIESKWRRKDGPVINVYITAAAMDTNDTGRDFIISVLDITGRIKAEEALRESSEKYRNLVELAVDGIILGTPDLMITEANSSMETITGLKKHDIIGRNFSSLFTAESVNTRPIRKDLLEKGGTVINERQILRPDGTVVLVETLSRRMPDGLYQSIFRDITESRRIMENMQRAIKLESLGTLAGGIAHDFNNILAGIAGYIELARRSGPGDDERAAYLDKAMLVFDRARKLTTRLTTFASGGDPVLRRGNLAQVVTEYTDTIMKGSDIKYSISIENGLWDCMFDSSQIGQVMYAVITNAKEFSPEGGEITVSARNTVIESGSGGSLPPGRYVMVSAKDNGPGIDPGVLKHIFDPFFTTKKTGDGLGLPTAYSIITRHKGVIEVESSGGHGSTVYFYLPAAEGEKKDAAVSTAEFHNGSGEVLVMDDEPFIREITSQMLGSMGYRVITAAGGEEALKILSDSEKHEDIRFIILDLTIPGGMGGKETVEAIRKSGRSTPVFAASGYSNDPVMSNPGKYGFTGSIRKPYRIKDISDLLNNHINHDNYPA